MKNLYKMFSVMLIVCILAFNPIYASSESHVTFFSTSSDDYNSDTNTLTIQQGNNPITTVQHVHIRLTFDDQSVYPDLRWINFLIVCPNGEQILTRPQMTVFGGNSGLDFNSNAFPTGTYQIYFWYNGNDLQGLKPSSFGRVNLLVLPPK